MNDIWTFTVAAVEFLKNSELVVKYAPFGFMDNLYNVNPADGLFTSTGLSDLGSYYANNG